MEFNPKVIERKELDYQFLLTKREQIESSIHMLCGFGSQVTFIPRTKGLGGAALLFFVRSDTYKLFFKVKSKNSLVESKLESEVDFPEIAALKNEYEIISNIVEAGGKNFVPDIKFFECIDGFYYLGLEYLDSFSPKLLSMGLPELMNVWNQLNEMVGFLYHNGIVHTDVHEDNLCFRGNQLVLVDFEEARRLKQAVRYEDSLDYAGKNTYGNVGERCSTGDTIGGYTSLVRLREILNKHQKNALLLYLKNCRFDNSPFNKDSEQHVDERIYQSISFDDVNIIGQRLRFDPRLLILKFVIGTVDGFKSYLDIGCNLGNFVLSAAKLDKVNLAIGIEASPECAIVANTLAFLSSRENIRIINAICGIDSISQICPKISVAGLFSVYHHIENREFFLEDLLKINPDVLLVELATQDRYYVQRGSYLAELNYICRVLGYSTSKLIGYSPDYLRPIYICTRGNVPNSILIKGRVVLKFSRLLVVVSRFIDARKSNLKAILKLI